MADYEHDRGHQNARHNGAHGFLKSNFFMFLMGQLVTLFGAGIYFGGLNHEVSELTKWQGQAQATFERMDRDGTNASKWAITGEWKLSINEPLRLMSWIQHCLESTRQWRKLGRGRNEEMGRNILGCLYIGLHYLCQTVAETFQGKGSDLFKSKGKGKDRAQAGGYRGYYYGGCGMDRILQATGKGI